MVQLQDSRPLRFDVPGVPGRVPPVLANGTAHRREDDRHESKQKPPRLLIVDGQQRLTSLYAVLRGEPVVREDYSTGRIEIAFNPLTQEFQVGDAATRKDKTVLPDISVLWAKDASLFDLVRTYLDGVATVRQLEPGERQAVEKSIQRLYSLRSYPFTALELASNVDDDQVAEVFVRVNSQGKSLVQSDFILTLMSVYWDEGRKQLELFCRDAKAPKPKSPHNHFIKPSPDQLLRIAVGLGFQRARLKHVYSLLRGKDLDTGAVTAERRAEQFQRFKEAQAKTLELAHWHGFFGAIRQAGYRTRRWSARRPRSSTATSCTWSGRRRSTSRRANFARSSRNGSS